MNENQGFWMGAEMLFLLVLGVGVVFGLPQLIPVSTPAAQGLQAFGKIWFLGIFPVIGTIALMLLLG